MGKSITVIKQEEKDIADIFKKGFKTEVVFRELQKDTVGRSGSSSTWGYVYYNEGENLQFKGVALRKEYDYDFPMAAYAEKTASIFGTELLGDRVRVPFIDIVEYEKFHDEIISYRLMDNNKEDMIHIKDTLFNKFERDDMKAKKGIYSLDEILECVRLQIEDEENYKKIEKDILHVLLLDAIMNNGDRHALNWALVRDKDTSQYQLAIFDHASAFVDMFDNKERFVMNGWTSTYITVNKDKGRTHIGSCGDKIIEHISTAYPEYFEEFCALLNEKLPSILEKVETEKMEIDFRRLRRRLEEKKRFLKKLRNRGELEYE